MDIKQIEVTCRQLVDGYEDKGEDGVFGYGGKLNIRPPYQREFVYNEKKRDAVINTIYHGYPLNTMYWADNGDGTFEIIDGQQRTVSICQYITGVFPYMLKFFENVKDPVERSKVLDYKLTIYVCSGTDTEKLKWFETVNIGGEELTPQELRNAVYHGSFVSDAKRYFSKTNCAAYRIGKNIVNGSPLRQQYLETALKWICNKQGINDISLYMAMHQNDADALELYNYYHEVITWVDSKFDVPKRTKIIKGLDWGALYEKYKNDKTLDKAELDKEITALLKDSEVTNKRGICIYVLTKDERYLGLRAFGLDVIESKYEEQKGICPICNKHFKLFEMEADHIVPWSKGGKTVESNCQMLCMHCNRTKSSKQYPFLQEFSQQHSVTGFFLPSCKIIFTI